MSKNTGKKFLSDLKLYSDYLKWKPELNRYETWEEACEDIIEGHRKKFVGIDLEEEFASALESMKDMRVFASQRTLQFRAPQLERSNLRVYNCSVLHAVKNTVFQETFYLGLNGCGVGISLLIPFIKNLSNIQKRNKGTKTFVVPDTIEGWSDALGVLMSSYFVDNQPFPEYAGYEIKFDYSLIRPKGAFLSGGFKAPGPDGLRLSLDKIETLIENWISKNGNIMRPILVYDIICHASDAVLSGSVRRSALIMLLDPNDEEMLNAKTGNWRQDNPQRARSNNSALIHRQSGTREFFDKVVGVNDGDSDLGFIFVNSWLDLQNPCLGANSKILTNSGEVSISTLNDGRSHIFINALGQEVTGKVQLTGFKPTVTLNLSNKNKITCTSDHIFLDVEGNEVPAELTKGKQLGHFSHNSLNFDDQFVKFGFIQGDGCLGRLKSNDHKGLEVNIGVDDDDVRKFFGITSTDRVYYLSDGTKGQLIELGFSSESLPTRELPETINVWTKQQKLSFLRGLWSANGCLIKNTRISFKSTCKKLIEQLSILLLEFGIDTYFTTNKSTKVKFKNGEYLCKESYDLNIGSYENMVKFNNLIGFIHEYKNQELLSILRLKSPKVMTIVKNKGIEPVYDFTLDDMTHIGVVNGVLTHNCAEISFTPVDTQEDVTAVGYHNLETWTRNNIDSFGVQMCNLCSMNAEKMTSKELFLRSCKDAAFIGTLQAAYTDFPYLSKASENITKREALLGVSMTGWMNNPKMFDAELLKTGSEIVKETNKKIASKIGVNPAARTTCVKPEGNLSVIAQTSSGIHPEHSERYFRIMQLNKGSDTAKWLEVNMPFLLEESVWSASKTDYVVFIPVTNPKGGLFKEDMKGLKHLELIRLVQENWVMGGTNKHLGISDNINHNVSATVIIDDRKQICDYIWNNKEIFTGVSFISDYGDKDFNQAPFTSVLTYEQVIEKYGKGTIFASGLIVDGLHYFNQNLWQACDCVKDKTISVGGTREEALLRKSWLDRAKKFAKNYFKGDLTQMVYCIKEVHLLHKWETISRQMKEVDFSKILTTPEYKDVSDYASAACSGKDGCSITRI